MAGDPPVSEEIIKASGDRLGEILAKMRAARTEFQEGSLTRIQYYEKIMDLDQDMTLRLADRFNRQSGFTSMRPGTPFRMFRNRTPEIIISLSEEELSDDFRAQLGRSLRHRMPDNNPEETFIDRLRARSDAPDGFFDEENLASSGKMILDEFTENHPQFSGFSYETALELIDGELSIEDAQTRFGNAEEGMVYAITLATLQTNIDRLKAERPEIAEEIEKDKVTLEEVIAEDFLVDVETDEEFEAWEAQKRTQIVDAIRQDSGLMEDIGRLKPLVDCENENDFLRQHRLRTEIARDMTEIFARVYDIPELRDRDVLNVYASMQKMEDDGTVAYANGIPGITDDEFVVIRHSLYRELLVEDPQETDNAVTKAYVSTVSEELRHAVDMQLAERLVNDDIDPDHPTFRHANLIFANKFYYTEDEDYYADQYVERTAKETAGFISSMIGNEVEPPPPPTIIIPENEAASTPAAAAPGTSN